MKKLSRICLILSMLCFFLTSCATAPRDTVFQTSTIDALLAGVYDGNMTGAALLEHGDFGIGTFDGLDGEMIVLDKTIYQVKADGYVYQPNAGAIKTPFATVCRFAADKEIPLKPHSDFAAVEAFLDTQIANPNLFYAIKITGRFIVMKTRSVPGQHKPYPPLKEVTAHQPKFEMQQIAGVIVGFRCPAYTQGVNVPGYHLHFLSNDRSRGGHILSFILEEGICQIDTLDKYFLQLPAETPAFAEADLSQDRSGELKAVEK